MFDFLREVVSKVPDYGHGHGHGHGHGNGQADATMEDRTISKRRLDPLLISLSLAPYCMFVFLGRLCQVDMLFLIGQEAYGG